ncbi:hypothetical protein M1310_01735 [Candidatus Marsarchaeota archaeon]|jgi:hypothetical protein|nr:hypothetical protein [Candidatus Marsarchaeota archaeon]
MKQERNTERELYDALEGQMKEMENLYGSGKGHEEKGRRVSDVRFATDLRTFVTELIRDRKLCERFRDLELRDLKYSINVLLDSDSLKFSISDGSRE